MQERQVGEPPDLDRGRRGHLASHVRGRGHDAVAIGEDCQAVGSDVRLDAVRRVGSSHELAKGIELDEAARLTISFSPVLEGRQDVSVRQPLEAVRIGVRPRAREGRGDLRAHGVREVEDERRPRAKRVREEVIALGHHVLGVVRHSREPDGGRGDDPAVVGCFGVGPDHRQEIGVRGVGVPRPHENVCASARRIVRGRALRTRGGFLVFQCSRIARIPGRPTSGAERGDAERHDEGENEGA